MLLVDEDPFDNFDFNPPPPYFMEGSETMLHQINMQKEELLAIVKANRESHRATFEKALEGYRKHCEEKLQERLDDLRNGKTPVISFSPPYPEDHTDDYDTVIRQLELHQWEEIDITGQEFAQFVEDNWSWKRQWATTTAAYAAS